MIKETAEEKALRRAKYWKNPNICREVLEPILNKMDEAIAKRKIGKK